MGTTTAEHGHAPVMDSTVRLYPISKPRPGGGDLVALVPRMALGPELRYKILVEHPARLHNF